MPKSLADLTQDMHRFVEAKGWYAADSPRPQTLRNLAVSLSIEAAELLEHIQWEEQPADIRAWSRELADILLYLLQLASLSQVDLEAAVAEKLQDNYRRTW
ncbi:MAG TPA: MazG nucleotide pyrophosphohydrolase domain-containing protein [Anaerolineales bacterium]|nr:MazG nucleotide pyrophosphohydrolase domain-containing protein [Anaerolineales bacterium]